MSFNHLLLQHGDLNAFRSTLKDRHDRKMVCNLQMFCSLLRRASLLLLFLLFLLLFHLPLLLLLLLFFHFIFLIFFKSAEPNARLEPTTRRSRPKPRSRIRCLTDEPPKCLIIIIVVVVVVLKLQLKMRFSKFGLGQNQYSKNYFPSIPIRKPELCSNMKIFPSGLKIKLLARTTKEGSGFTRTLRLHQATSCSRALEKKFCGRKNADLGVRQNLKLVSDLKKITYTLGSSGSQYPKWPPPLLGILTSWSLSFCVVPSCPEQG